MGCKFSKKSSGRVGVIETFKSAHYQPLISSKITRKLRTRKKDSRKLEYSSNIKFSDFSTTSATYVKSASETSKITVRLSCDGSTLEIEQCDTTHEIVDDLSEIKVFNERVVRSLSVPILSSCTHSNVKKSKFESMGLNMVSPACGAESDQNLTLGSSWFNEKYNFENIDKTRCPLACQISDEMFPTKCDTCTDIPATAISRERMCSNLTSVDIHIVPETNFHSYLPVKSSDERKISDGNVILFSSELHGDYSTVLCQDDSSKLNSDVTSMIGSAEARMERYIKQSEDGVNETHFTDIRKPQCYQGQFLSNSCCLTTYGLQARTKDTHDINTFRDEAWFNLLTTESFNKQIVPTVDNEAISLRTKNPSLPTLPQQSSDTTLTNVQKIGGSESNTGSSYIKTDKTCNQESRTVKEHDIKPNQLLTATYINQQDVKTLDLNFGEDITSNQLTSTRSNNSDLGSLDCVNSYVVDTRMDDIEHHSNSQTARFLFMTSNHGIEISPNGDFSTRTIFPNVSNNPLSCFYDDCETESKNQLVDGKFGFVETEFDTDIDFENRLRNGNSNVTDKSDSILNDAHNSSDWLSSIEHFQDENSTNSSGINGRKVSFKIDMENHASSNNDNLHYSYSIKSYRDSAKFAPINNLIETEFKTKELIDDLGNCDTILCQRTCPHMTYLEKDSGFSDSFL
ncbi:hypothetical protein LOTGIDRAFT_171314 [Lottia gigantea]|uniref:Uncharacterized protein n=1 Tax=Lottia gigantea TaxID=225164 RepID=V4AHI9_LOTGI|nr:hypothetical protein LOTGIDRAFT_171314 [Lottia gigantea]ESP03524.1 hypothetical protein LOTGIDRAFT_171314 [Lottia gigantea]